jgi:RIO-like serine/threonine protein kinase
MAIKGTDLFTEGSATRTGAPGPVNRSVPILLKADTFGTITRDGERVIRDTRGARTWARPLARYLMRREQRALSHLASFAIPGIPRLLAAGRGSLTRGWIDGQPMQVARPRDPAYFRSALKLLRQLHAANVLHNDLAKETNWLVTPDGQPALVDFQLATVLKRRGASARARGHDDLRHLLKHKRTYLPERLTAREKRVLARRSLLSRAWMASGKKAYLFITRRILRWQDREGAGDRRNSSGR